MVRRANPADLMEESQAGKQPTEDSKQKGVDSEGPIETSQGRRANRQDPSGNKVKPFCFGVLLCVLCELLSSLLLCGGHNSR